MKRRQTLSQPKLVLFLQTEAAFFTDFRVKQKHVSADRKRIDLPNMLHFPIGQWLLKTLSNLSF
jgi:hypothetical protein